MNKFLKIFDVVFLVVFVSYALALAATIFSLITTDKTFMAYIHLSIGLSICIRAPIKIRPFYISHKTKWPIYYLYLFFAASFIFKALSDLAGPPLLGWTLFILSFVFLFLSVRKGELKKE